MMVLKATALMGATGTGKSALAIRVAQVSNTSIICCDSMQLYRGLNIGTAKPTEAERDAVPHFMVDCCDLSDVYSAARWAKEARIVIEQENKQGRIPLIVGGTGLYLRALLQGFADIPPEKPQIRQRFEVLQRDAGTAALYGLLRHKDPDMALRLKAGDTQRIMRALCVCESTGKTLSAWQQRDNQADPIDCPVFVLDVERDKLRQRLADRFQAMLSAGWLDEVRWLNAQNLSDTHPAMRAVGYRQLLDHLHGAAVSMEQAVTDGITATRRYAKRQVTWFHNQTPNAVHGDSGILEMKIQDRIHTQ